MKEIDYFNYEDDLEKDFSINLKKILFTFWNRKKLVVEVFTAFLCFFVLITFLALIHIYHLCYP